jgi:hypothetical protein
LLESDLRGDGAAEAVDPAPSLLCGRVRFPAFAFESVRFLLQSDNLGIGHVWGVSRERSAQLSFIAAVCGICKFASPLAQQRNDLVALGESAADFGKVGF